MVKTQPEVIINKICKIIDANLNITTYAMHTILRATIYSECPKSNTLK